MWCRWVENPGSTTTTQVHNYKAVPAYSQLGLKSKSFGHKGQVLHSRHAPPGVVCLSGRWGHLCVIGWGEVTDQSLRWGWATVCSNTTSRKKRQAKSKKKKALYQTCQRIVKRQEAAAQLTSLSRTGVVPLHQITSEIKAQNHRGITIIARL